MSINAILASTLLPTIQAQTAPGTTLRSSPGSSIGPINMKWCPSGTNCCPLPPPPHALSHIQTKASNPHTFCIVPEAYNTPPPNFRIGPEADSTPPPPPTHTHPTHRFSYRGSKPSHSENPISTPGYT